MKRKVVFAAVAAILLGSATARAAVINVNTTNETSTAPGECTLAQAILASQNDTAAGGCPAGLGSDVINLPAGTYTLTTPLNGATYFHDLGKTVSIQGAGPDQTIIERAPTAPDFRFFNGLQESGAVISLSGLTLRNGKTQHGAAIRTYGGVLNIDNCVFTDNNAGQGSGEGGAISTANFAARMTISNSRFQNNQAFNGGAIQTSGKLTLLNTTFNTNRSTGNGGGAIRYSGSANDFLQVSNCAFFGNEGALWGGGAIHANGVIRVDHSSFSSNSATGGQSALGGAIYAMGTSLLIEACEFYNNQSYSHGAALDTYSLPTGVVVRDSSFYNNRSEGRGGAVRGGGTFLNCTFSDNTAAQEGGAIHAQRALTLNNVSIANNNAGSVGGGIRFDASSGFKLSNTVIAKNTIHTSNPTPSDCQSDGPIVTGGYNVVGVNCGITAATGDQLGTLAAPLDPQLAALDQVTHTLMPLPTSPLVDQGNPAAAGTADACEAKDQTGTDRPIDGDADGNSRCDIGVVEAPTRPLNDLGVTVNANPMSLVVGLANVTFSTVVQNKGNRQATGIQVVHVLSAGLEYLSCSPANACVASSADPKIIECTTPELSPATSALVVVRAKATAAGALTDHVSVEALEYDPAASDNFALASVAASAPSADVAVTLESQTVAPHVGLPLTLVTTVTNNGPHPAAGVALTQDGLAGLHDLTVVTAPSGTCTGTEAISCTLGDLAANAAVTVTVRGVPQAAGSLETLALAQAGTGDPNAANNGVSLQVSVAAMPPDASAPGPDASEPPGPDAAQPGADAAQPGPDAAQPGPDADQPGPDADQPGPDASSTVSGPDAGDAPPVCPDTPSCGCGTGGGTIGGLGLAMALMVLVPWRRRRR
ncbi:MAG: hypothetical protein HY901_22290 [Deltaproteobacteria bacterium]|nr:hypothetical protein [Deltaproteobacteria bacterium]